MEVAINKTAFCPIANINILRLEPSTHICSKFPPFNSTTALSAIHKIVAVVAATCISLIFGGRTENIGKPSKDTMAINFTLGIDLVNFFIMFSTCSSFSLFFDIDIRNHPLLYFFHFIKYMERFIFNCF